jgi:hypothetical protein
LNDIADNFYIIIQDGLVYAGVSAPDKDLAGTPFATVTYVITKVAPAAGEGLFKLKEEDNKADILVAKALTDLFGAYTVTITVSFRNFQS